jgi:hypothetical protein
MAAIHQLFCFSGAALYETMIPVASLKSMQQKPAAQNAWAPCCFIRPPKTNRSSEGNAIGLKITALFEEDS